MGCHALLQGIFLTQVSHVAGRFFTVLSHQGSPHLINDVLKIQTLPLEGLQGSKAFAECLEQGREEEGGRRSGEEEDERGCSTSTSKSRKEQHLRVNRGPRPPGSRPSCWAEAPCGAGHQGSWVGKIPWRGACDALQYSCLENPMDRGAWRATVCGVSKSRAQVSH